MKTPEELNNIFNHHAPATPSIAGTHTQFRAECRVLAEVINALVPAGREQDLAFDKLEEVMFWGNAGIARANAVD